MSQSADPRLYVALDLPSVDDAKAMIDRLGDAVMSYKIGLQLLPIGGMDLARELKAAGKNVFLDFKLHDIGATVQKAARSIAGLGADLLTVHATPQVMEAAVRGVEGSPTQVLGVTVLTSLTDDDLTDMGYAFGARDLVLRRVRQAWEAGCHGIVSSPLEVAAIRSVIPDDMLIVTPGVRPAGADKGDQQRIATPREALQFGATHLVVGRPITQADDPKAAAEAITAEMDGN